MTIYGRDTVTSFYVYAYTRFKDHWRMVKLASTLRSKLKKAASFCFSSLCMRKFCKVWLPCVVFFMYRREWNIIHTFILFTFFSRHINQSWSTWTLSFSTKYPLIQTISSLERFYFKFRDGQFLFQFSSTFLFTKPWSFLILYSQIFTVYKNFFTQNRVFYNCVLLYFLHIFYNYFSIWLWKN